MAQDLPVENDAKVEEAQRMLERILLGMGVSASIEILRQEGRVVLNATCGEDDSVVIGRKGKTLEAIQHVVNLALRRCPEGEEKVSIDVSGYRERRRRNLRDAARRATDQALEFGYPVLIGPFNSYERHIIHTFLAGNGDILAESQGEGEMKKMLLRPRHLIGQSSP